MKKIRTTIQFKDGGGFVTRTNTYEESGRWLDTIIKDAKSEIAFIRHKTIEDENIPTDRVCRHGDGGNNEKGTTKKQDIQNIKQ